MKTSEVLNKAADLIEERGWSKGGGWNESPTSPICLEGGILAALGQSFDDMVGTKEAEDEFRACPSYAAVMAYLATDDRWGVFRGHAYDWNDAAQRTADEVIEVLRATAVIEAARENANTPVEVS